VPLIEIWSQKFKITKILSTRLQKFFQAPQEKRGNFEGYEKIFSTLWRNVSSPKEKVMFSPKPGPGHVTSCVSAVPI